VPTQVPVMTASRSSPDVDGGENGGPGTLSNWLSGILETFEALQRYHDLIGEAVSWVDCHRIKQLVPFNESTWHFRSHFPSGQLSVSRAVCSVRDLSRASEPQAVFTLRSAPGVKRHSPLASKVANEVCSLSSGTEFRLVLPAFACGGRGRLGGI
jgi:hypothetical protein